MTQISKRESVKTLLMNSTLSLAHISKSIGVSLATIYNIKKRINDNTSLEHKGGAGRPPTLRNSIKRSISSYVRHNPHISLRSLASNLPINVSHETVRSSLIDLNYEKSYPKNSPLLTDTHKLNRLKWARKYRYPLKDWSKTIFVDEMSIWLTRGRVKMWTKKTQKRIFPTTKHSPKINVWAAFSSMGVFPLCIFDKIMDSNLFIHIMERYLLCQADVFHERDWRLVMDNDPKHNSRLTVNWLEKNVPKRVPWPSQSPDLNPIENLFAWVKQKLIKTGPKSIQQLKINLEKIWQDVEPDFLMPYWKSMPRRLKMVIDSNGEAINY